MSAKPQSPWSEIDKRIGELALETTGLNRTVLPQLYLKYDTGNFDEVALDVFVRRNEIVDLFEEIKKVRSHPLCTIDGIAVLIARANFKIKNIRTKVAEVMQTRTERYAMQIEPN